MPSCWLRRGTPGTRGTWHDGDHVLSFPIFFHLKHTQHTRTHTTHTHTHTHTHNTHNTHNTTHDTRHTTRDTRGKRHVWHTPHRPMRDCTRVSDASVTPRVERRREERRREERRRVKRCVDDETLARGGGAGARWGGGCAGANRFFHPTSLKGVQFQIFKRSELNTVSNLRFKLIFSTGGPLRNGVVVLNVVEPEENLRREAQRQGREALMCYWGFSFEEQCTGGGYEQPVDCMDSFCTVVRTAGWWWWCLRSKRAARVRLMTRLLTHRLTR